MADTYSDDDPDSAAMAEAMGFTGFGMQRSNKKRKLTTPPSQTGANNAPLGKRRPLNLPQPVLSEAGGDGDDGGEEDGNPEEIDLDGDDGEGDADAAGIQVNGGEGDADVVNERAVGALTVSDDAPATTGPPQHHHPLPPRPQQQNHHHDASRRPGGRQGQGQVPWWEGEWDPRLVARMIENPWDRLEKQRGLGALGTWPASTARGGGGGGPAASRGGEGEDVSSSSGGGVGGALVGSLGEQASAAQTTVS
ncbi:hypothetical protein F5883DRAFT_140097 [Diaporthe sp. PMI_573]|nr:hypothetical protein F5883DRAFT_140097 [Diaporthaceae sp. PMI_573]